MKHKVVVYGSLLEGLGNHPLLQRHGARKLGTFKTKPEFTMVSLGGFPGVTREGNTSITVEVYEVDDACLKDLNSLEGYRGEEQDNFYDREEIETPFGKSFIYTYNHIRPTSAKSQVENGDWKEYIHQKSPSLWTE